MFKKIAIAGLLMALLIQKLKHLEELRARTPVIPVAEIDDLLKYWPNLSIEERVSFKMLLYRKRIINENRWFSFQPNNWDKMTRQERLKYLDRNYPRKY